MKRIRFSACWMTGQLFLMGILLVYLFRWDNSWLNIAWVIVMMFFACFAAMVNSKISFRHFFGPVFLSYFAGTGFVLLSLGANQQEALLPYFRDAMLAAMRPFLANMATMGIVSLPGMMTGQILGGAAPQTAIKYQIAIVLAIFAALTISVSLSIYFSSRRAFDDYGILKPGLFRE